MEVSGDRRLYSDLDPGNGVGCVPSSGVRRVVASEESQVDEGPQAETSDNFANDSGQSGQATVEMRRTQDSTTEEIYEFVKNAEKPTDAGFKQEKYSCSARVNNVIGEKIQRKKLLTLDDLPETCFVD